MPQNPIGNTKGHPILFRWDDFMNMQKIRQRPIYDVGGVVSAESPEEYILLDDTFVQPNIQQRFLARPISTASKVLNALRMATSLFPQNGLFRIEEKGDNFLEC